MELQNDCQPEGVELNPESSDVILDVPAHIITTPPAVEPPWRGDKDYAVRMEAIESMISDEGGKDCIVEFHGRIYTVRIIKGFEDQEVVDVCATLMSVDGSQIQDSAEGCILQFSFVLDRQFGAILSHGYGPFPNRTMVDMFLRDAIVKGFEPVVDGVLPVRARFRSSLLNETDPFGGGKGLSHAVE